MRIGFGTTKHVTQRRTPQSAGVSPGRCLRGISGVLSAGGPFLPSAASGNPPAAAKPRAAAPAPDISVPRIPDSVQSNLFAARRTWLDRCVNAPLVDTATNSRVHLYGNVHFAPLGGPEGLADLQELLERVQPTVLAIEQPYDLGARAGLPYPEVIHHLTSLFPDAALPLAGPCYSPGLAGSGFGSQHPQSGAAAAGSAAAVPGSTELERLQSLLPGLAQPARVGRDLLDPFEVFGLYGGCDYVTRPSQLLEALSLFGHLPGLEYAALVVAAQQLGVQVCGVDAPLRLQEKWAAQLVSDFTLAESDLSRRLQHDLARAQSLLPPSYHSWDASLAEALRRLERQQREGGIGAARSGAAAEPSLSTVTAYKVSRAVAAAQVPYETSSEAFALQAALQPLKFAFFARKARHLVMQVRDLCQRMSMRQVRVDAGSFQSTAAGAGAGQGVQSDLSNNKGSVVSGGGRGEAAPEGVALVDVSDQPEKVVLAVVGRQYVSYIEELWANERSVLWHGDVPRTFAPSTLDKRGLS